MKLNIPFATVLAVVTILCTAIQCHDDALSTGEKTVNCGQDQLPTWLNDIISDLEESPNKGEIIQYLYNYKTVYLVNTCLDCSDSMTEVFDCQQNVICRFGGIAGFNTCPDFSQKAKNEKVIWHN